ncbi:MAG: Gfo/Idh/MocA family oxidoreductase [Verrucomicrobiae bacterium]|nr:Gfo/Idh/MocA family oxidoreductase [Verrucomicrobiae bacterium]
MDFMKDEKVSNVISRRQFVKGLAIGAAAVQIVPGHILGLNGQTPPSQKLNIAGIGIGGQGRADLDNMASENIVALCDVDWSYASGTFKKYPNAKKYKDFRKMLDEQKDIDAVVVATPDHLHAFAAMYAINNGKHVYCEKPLTHSVWEARQLAKAAREKKLATQMGNQGQASEETRRLCEFVWDGAIGNVYEAHIWTDRPSNGLFKEYWPQGVEKPKETPPVPPELDWDLWIGPAPMRAYHPIYHPFRWRGWWDFGTGALGDIGCHAFDPVFRALKLGHPLTIEASSSRVNEETFPVASMVTYHFPARGSMPPLKLVWYDGGLRPPRPEGLDDGHVMGTNGRLLIGDKGFILGNRVYPEKRRKEYQEPQKTIPRSPGHYQEWILACKGGKPAGSNFDWAGPLTEVVLLGNIALRLQLREELTRCKLEWDAEKFEFKNLPEANKFIRREYREGWKLV